MKPLNIVFAFSAILLAGCAQPSIQQQKPKVSISAFHEEPFTPFSYSSPSENLQSFLNKAAWNCELMQSSGQRMREWGLEDAADAYRQNLRDCKSWALRNGSTAFSEAQKAKRSATLEQADKTLYVKFTSYIGSLTINTAPDLMTKNAYKEAETLQKIEQQTVKK